MRHTTQQPIRTFTIDALLAEGFPLSTIEYYKKKGILPRAEGGRGRNAYYTVVHISVLREIKKARDENRSLTDIRDWADYQFPWKKRERIAQAARMERDES